MPAVWRQAWRNLSVIRGDRDAELSESLDEDDATLLVDVTRMEQVFRNLFENSLAACGNSARIAVTCRDGGTGHIEVLVQDNGPGLTPEQKEKLFEPFFTTKDTGTGLGMAIVDRIIQAHQGHITVSELEAPGATFCIRLPRNPKQLSNVDLN